MPAVSLGNHLPWPVTQATRTDVPGGGIVVVWPCHQQEGNAGEVADMYFFTTFSKPFGCDFGCGVPLRDINSEELELPQGGNESKVGVNSGGKGPASQPAIF